MRKLILVLTGFAAIVVDAGPPPNCTDEEYYFISQMNVSAMTDCITNVHVDNWTQCIITEQVSSDGCAEHIGESIQALNLATCGFACVPYPTTLNCRICMGVVAIQGIVQEAPDTPYGMCGNQYDHDVIMNADASAVVGTGHVSELFSTVTTLSDSCNYCLPSGVESGLDEEHCGSACTDFASAECYNCLNLYWAAAFAFCTVDIADGSCSESDFVALDQMNIASVKGCMEHTNGDGLVHCLTDGTSVNLNETCAVTLDGAFDYYAFYDCSDYCTVDTSIECANCKGAIMVYQTFAYDSVMVNGSCGTEEDRSLINDVNMTAVYECGLTTPYAGATCIASVANVSTPCDSCLTLRTQHAQSHCSAHCHDPSSSDCLECVNIGLVSAAAHCNAHMSAAAGMTGISLISFAALISTLFLV